MKKLFVLLMLVLSVVSCANAQGLPPSITTMRGATYYLYLPGEAPPHSAIQIPMDQHLAYEQIDFPQVAAYGFNTVLLVEFRWKFEGFDPATFTFNGVYDPAGLANFRAELETARANGLRVMIGLNYASGFQIEKPGSLAWYEENTRLQSWLRYVNYILTSIDDYRDMVYPVVFEEGQIGASYAYGEWDAEATALRGTVGNLPALLDPALRTKWTFGWYGAGTALYATVPASTGYDWVGNGMYYFDNSITLSWLAADQKGWTDEQMQTAWSNMFDRLTRLYPGTPVAMFEGGYYTCSSETFERQAQVYALLAKMNIERGYGFNLWGYRSLVTPEQECLERGGKGGHSMGNPDGSPRPAMLAVSALLKPTVIRMTPVLPTERPQPTKTIEGRER